MWRGGQGKVAQSHTGRPVAHRRPQSAGTPPDSRRRGPLAAMRKAKKELAKLEKRAAGGRITMAKGLPFVHVEPVDDVPSARIAFGHTRMLERLGR